MQVEHVIMWGGHVSPHSACKQSTCASLGLRPPNPLLLLLLPQADQKL